jgi:hypothetical protein
LVLLVIWNVRFWVTPGSPSSTPVAHGFTVCAPASSFTVWFAPAVNTGTSLTPLIVIVKFCAVEVSTPPFAVPPSSDSVTVIDATPLMFAAGV